MDSYWDPPQDDLQIVPEVFFSLFMHDWYDPEPDQEYEILEKVELFCEAGSSLENIVIDLASQRKVEPKTTSEQIDESIALLGNENISGDQLNNQTK